MTIRELSAPILAGIGLIGLIVLLAIGKDVSLLLPIETTLIGFVAGVNMQNIVVGVKRIFKK